MSNVIGLHSVSEQEVVEQIETAKREAQAVGARGVACVVLLADDSVRTYYAGKMAEVMGCVAMLQDVLQVERREGE